MKTLKRSAPATRHLFIYICAANEKRRLLHIQHLVWIRLDPLGSNRGRFVLHVSPWFLTEQERAVGSYIQLTLMLQTFCWVGTFCLVIMNSWSWWNHPEFLMWPCSHHASLLNIQVCNVGLLLSACLTIQLCPIQTNVWQVCPQRAFGSLLCFCFFVCLCSRAKGKNPFPL